MKACHCVLSFMSQASWYQGLPAWQCSAKLPDDLFGAVQLQMLCTYMFLQHAGPMESAASQREAIAGRH